jgi:ubiquinone/menaquinone biosynthesis C-methylase UbiE
MSERIFKARDAQRLEDAARLRALPPDEVVAALSPVAGLTVADIGAGTGYFTLPLARAGARVLAVDMQPEMLALLRARLEPALPVELIQATAAQTHLGDACCDLAYYANIWHELDHHVAVLKEARRIVRDGGRIAIVDWRSDVAHESGPRPEHRIAMDETARMLEAAGWNVRSQRAIGQYSYLVIATR